MTSLADDLRKAADAGKPVSRLLLLHAASELDRLSGRPPAKRRKLTPHELTKLAGELKARCAYMTPEEAAREMVWAMRIATTQPEAPS